MVWRAFTVAGVKKLMLSDKSVKAKEIIKTLEKELLPSIQFCEYCEAYFFNRTMHLQTSLR